ncbi:hypothetical protein RB195_011704 [Necator americanus]|uniref:Uncharacterized protein n=1 Tax=Necator americanus TaxID=51031 RepID=A0ABR1D3P8_NECAM
MKGLVCTKAASNPRPCGYSGPLTDCATPASVCSHARGNVEDHVRNPPPHPNAAFKLSLDFAPIGSTPQSSSLASLSLVLEALRPMPPCSGGAQWIGSPLYALGVSFYVASRETLFYVSPANTVMESDVKTRRQTRELELHGVKQPLLFLENYKRGVGSMSSSARNHNNRFQIKKENLGSESSTHTMTTRQRTKEVKSAAKGDKSLKRTETPKTPKTSRAVTTSVRKHRTLKAIEPGAHKRAIVKGVTRKTAIHRTGHTPKYSTPKNRSVHQYKKLGGTSSYVSYPTDVRYTFPIPDHLISGLGGNAKKRAAKTDPGSKKHSPKRSPPSLSEEERGMVPSFSADVNPSFDNDTKDNRIVTPAILTERKRRLVALFDSLLPAELFDGRMDIEEMENMIRSFAENLMSDRKQPNILRLPTNNSNIPSNQAVVPADLFGHEIRHPQDPGANSFGNVRMVSEGRQENYGLGAFQDANISALLPNTPVYSAARLRNLVHKNGTAMTERKHTEIVPVEKLEPHQLQLLKEKGFRLVKLDVPTDQTSLTKMQRLAFADMCDEKKVEVESIEY